MGIRIGDECKAVERTDAPVHGRVGGKAGLEGMNLTREAAKAFLDCIEP